MTPVATAFAMAGQIYIAQLAGARRTHEQRDAIGSFLTLMLLMALGFMVLTFALRRPILNWLNCPQEAFDQAESYMVITAAGLPFIFGYNAICGVLRGMGESKRPLYFIIIAAVADIFLDLLLVAVFQMEAAGTAIATAASQAAACGAAFVCLYHNRKQFGLERISSILRLKSTPVRVILTLGIPQAARSTLVRLSILWVNSSVNAYGLIASTTNSVGNKLQKFLEIFSSSMTQAGGAMVGQNLGAQAHSRARKVVTNTCAACLIVAAVISLMIFAFPKEVFGIFTTDPSVLDMGVKYLYIMIVHFKIGLSVCFVTFFSMGVYGYFWGTALSRVLPGICIGYFASGKWKNNKLLKKTAQ